MAEGEPMRPLWLASVVLCALWAAANRADRLQCSGLVLDSEDGAPIDSARVRVVFPAIDNRTSNVSTQPDGRFVLHGVPAGPLRLRIGAPGYQEMEWLMDMRGGANFTFRLWKLGVVAGRVLNADGEPVAGAVAAVMLTDEQGRLSRLPPDRIPDAVAVTGAGGEYRLFGIPPGRYAVGVNRPIQPPAMVQQAQDWSCWAGPHVIEIPAEGGTASADFLLQRAELATVKGKADWVPERGRAVAALTPAEFPAITAARTLLRQDGSFEFSGVPAGRYLLSAVGPSLGNAGLAGLPGQQPVFGEAELSISPGETVETRLSLLPSRPVPLRLGAPQSGPRPTCEPQAAVRLFPASGIAPVLDLAVDIPPDGAEAVLPPVKLSAWIEGTREGCFGPATPVQLLDSSRLQEQTIPLIPGASLAGTVLSRSDEPGRRFVVLLAAERLLGNGPGWIGFYADPDGRFAARGLPPGIFRVHVFDARDWADPRFRMPGLEAARIELPPGGTAGIELPAPAARDQVK